MNKKVPVSSTGTFENYKIERKSGTCFNKGKRIEDMFPYLFDDDDIEPAESISEDEVRELQGLIQAVNEKGTM